MTPDRTLSKPRAFALIVTAVVAATLIAGPARAQIAALQLVTSNGAPMLMQGDTAWAVVPDQVASLPTQADGVFWLGYVGPVVPNYLRWASADPLPHIIQRPARSGRPPSGSLMEDRSQTWACS
jgi:hypothetical protein